MRPPVLNPLFAALSVLPGIGPKLEKVFARLIGREGEPPRIIDLLFHLPAGFVDRRNQPKLSAVEPDTVVTVAVTVDRHRPPPPKRPRSPYNIEASDDTNSLTITYFNARPDYLHKLLPEGELRYVSGTATVYDGHLQMVHPDRVVDAAGFAKLPLIDPVYPLTEGLRANQLHKAIELALDRVPELPEWQDSAWIERNGFPGFAAALRSVHRPATPADLEPQSPAWSRLAYDELLAGQLALALLRGHMRRRAGRGTAAEGRLRAKIIAALPYSLTPSQDRAVADIIADMAQPNRMLRLLHGDVGSGKTLVALLAAATVIEAGRQAAFMAPTEILARQHFSTIAPLAAAAGIRLAVLTGRERGARAPGNPGGARRGRDRPHRRHARLVPGRRDIPRSGARRRRRATSLRRSSAAGARPQGRGRRSPRAHGDADPAHASPHLFRRHGCLGTAGKTRRPAKDRHPRTADRAAERSNRSGERALKDGRRVYWVCPLVAESESIDLAAAEDRYEALKKRFGDAVALVHGQMRGAEKDRAMARFAEGAAQILVATTVIEVGVDVPEASVMVIEHAERFGLAQLHQLRGRIGRGSERSTCLLLYKGPLGETAKARLAILRDTDDGFRIAEEDLRLRGEGDVLGTRQSGMPGFRLARLEVHGKLLSTAREDAALVLNRDPKLTTPRGAALRLLLYLFARDEAIRLLGAG